MFCYMTARAYISSIEYPESNIQPLLQFCYFPTQALLKQITVFLFASRNAADLQSMNPLTSNSTSAASPA